MRSINQTNCIYISPNKTIEEVLISTTEKEKVLFIYNYKGISYRVFSSKHHLDEFFKYGSELDHHFSTEKELDKYLEQITL